MFRELAWRQWSCPRTVEAAARHFVEHRISLSGRAILANPDSWGDYWVIDWKRIIAYAYGLARIDGPPSRDPWPPGWRQRLLLGETVAICDGTWSPGWNRRLIADAGGEPELAAERILKRVSELAIETTGARKPA